MKKIFTLLASLLFTMTFAQQRLIAIKGAVTDTIANTLEQAIAIAQPGDKIYLPGGFFEHLPAIDKQVYIIGTGFQDGMNVMGRTAISGSLTLAAGANGSTFEGLFLTEYFSQTANTNSDNITIKRCNFKGTIEGEQGGNCSFTNSYFINCVIRESLHLGYYILGQNNYIQNCIITNWVARTNASTVENCLFVGVYACTNTIVKKSILYRNDGACDAINSCTDISLIDNLFSASCYLSINYYSTILSEYGSQTFTNFSDVFVNVPNDPFFNFNQMYDYHLKTPFAVMPQNFGLFNGSKPWKVGSLPIIPNIELNNSYLDVLEGNFKLNVKVVPQTH